MIYLLMYSQEVDLKCTTRWHHKFGSRYSQELPLIKFQCHKMLTLTLTGK